jgi:hypothetical protein
MQAPQRHSFIPPQPYIASDFFKEVLMVGLVNFISKRVIYRFDVNNVFGHVGLCS